MKLNIEYTSDSFDVYDKNIPNIYDNKHVIRPFCSTAGAD